MKFTLYPFINIVAVTVCDHGCAEDEKNYSKMRFNVVTESSEGLQLGHKKASKKQQTETTKYLFVTQGHEKKYVEEKHFATFLYRSFVRRQGWDLMVCYLTHVDLF